MTLPAIIIIILLIANLIWGIQTSFRAGWPFLVNLIGIVLLAIVTFTSVL